MRLKNLAGRWHTIRSLAKDFRAPSRDLCSRQTLSASFIPTHATPVVQRGSSLTKFLF